MKILSRIGIVCVAGALLTACDRPQNSSSPTQTTNPIVTENHTSNNTKQNPKAGAEPIQQTVSEAERAQSATKSGESCSMIMGFDIWEPYQYIDIGRQVKGLDVEMINLIAERIDCTISYRQDTWLNLLKQIREGKVDFVLGASITDARKQYAWFSQAYRQETFQLYVRGDESHKYRQASIAEFVTDGNQVGVIGEYFYGDRLSGLMDSERFQKNFVPAIMSEINVARLLDGDIDGFVEDINVGATLIRRKGLSQYVAPHHATVVTGDVYVMFSQKSVPRALVEKFNRALAVIKSNGQYDEVVRKYQN